jgi:hypothetical protein
VNPDDEPSGIPREDFDETTKTAREHLERRVRQRVGDGNAPRQIVGLEHVHPRNIAAGITGEGEPIPGRCPVHARFAIECGHFDGHVATLALVVENVLIVLPPIEDAVASNPGGRFRRPRKAHFTGLGTA